MNRPILAETSLPQAIAIQVPRPAALPARDREQMLQVAELLERCQRALSKAGLNVVGELLKGHDGFFEMNHYPDGDVYDAESGAQYYYHAHRGGGVEHGHFHTFLRAPGMPRHLRPLHHPEASEPWPAGDAAIAHLVAVSMDAWGRPLGLFSCNRWVTGENWYPAGAVAGMLERFSIDHAYPSWPGNLWLSALLGLFRPQIEALLDQRDRVIAAWQAVHPEGDVFEDRRLEITGYLPISVEGWVQQLRAAA